MSVDCSPQETVHKNELAHRPLDWFDGMLGNDLVITQQSYMRRISRHSTLQSHLRRDFGEALVKKFQPCNTVPTAKNKRAIAETHDLIEPDAERR